MPLYQTLREGREKAQLKQEDVAKTINVDQAMISKVERGKLLPSQRIVLKLAEVYGLNRDKIMEQWILSKAENKKEALSKAEHDLIVAFRLGDLAKAAKILAKHAEHAA